MARIEWARSSQFNWVYDNLGGTPLMAAVAGKADGAIALVQADGSVRIEAPNSGGGQVFCPGGLAPGNQLRLGRLLGRAHGRAP
jgi:hypothetical protein